MSKRPLSVEQALAMAGSLAEQGNRARAIRLYRAVLEKFPGNRQAVAGLRALGQAASGPGPVDQAIADLIGLYGRGRFREALERGAVLARQHPRLPVIPNILGAVHAAMGQADEAIASYNEAIRLAPGYAEPHNNLGNLLCALGRYEAAVGSLTRAIELKPGYAEAHSNLGIALAELGRHEEAVASLSRAVDLKPDFVEAHFNMAAALEALGRNDEAVTRLREAIALRPGYAEAHSSLGIALAELGRHEEAVASLTQAIRLDPDLAEAHLGLGNLLSNLGRHAEAAASYAKVLEIDPGFAEVHRTLGAIMTYKPGDPRIAQMEALIADPAISESDRMHLGFALGKAYDDTGDAERCFRHLLEGNRLRKKDLGYDIAADRKLFARIRSAFAQVHPIAVPQIEPDAKQSVMPIFIVGMPRSGTTLAEQILASHSQVHGAGELRLLNAIMMPALDEIENACAGRLTADLLHAIRKRYLTGLEEAGGGKPYVTDKMPLNFRWIGFVLKAIPEAKVVNLQREPAAVCWSLFKHYFTAKGNGYAYDLEELAEYYKLYCELMNFWRNRFPGQVHDLGYEELTESPEAEIRKLLEHCGLDWEDRCLAFHESGRVVKTASSVQVRQGIYRGSSEAWRRYEAYLAPMLRALERQGQSSTAACTCDSKA